MDVFRAMERGYAARDPELVVTPGQYLVCFDDVEPTAIMNGKTVMPSALAKTFHEAVEKMLSHKHEDTNVAVLDSNRELVCYRWAEKVGTVPDARRSDWQARENGGGT